MSYGVNVAYPNGRCEACGFGVTEDERCMNMECGEFDGDFEDIARNQGWSNATVEHVLMSFIDNYADKAQLIRFALAVAERENGE